MKWKEVFKESPALPDEVYLGIRKATAILLFGSRIVDRERVLTDEEEEIMVGALMCFKDWTRKLLRRCGAGPEGKVIVIVRGGVAEVLEHPEDIVVEIQDYDNEMR